MKRIKRVISLCLALLMVLTICPQKVEAASYTFRDDPIKIAPAASWYGDGHYYVYSLVGSNSKKVKITKVTLKNKALATVTISDDKKGIKLRPKKTGNTTLKVTVANGSKTKTYSIKLYIYKYNNPAKSYKIGGTEYKSKFAKENSTTVKKPKKAKNVKVQFTAQTGYEVSSITYYYTENGVRKSKSLRNGQTFKINSKAESIQVNFRNQKKGYISNLCVWFK